MTDDKETPADSKAAFAILKAVMPYLSGVQKADITLMMAIAALSQKPEMHPDQKADLLGAAMAYYRLTILCDFIRNVCTDRSGAPEMGLALDPGDEAARIIKARMAAGYEGLGQEQAKALERFRTLYLMVGKDPEQSGG